MTVALEVLIIVLLVLGNGVLAMAEAAMIPARRARLERRAQEGDRGAGVALQVGAEPGRFLSALQIGITLVGVLAGAFGGATLAEELAAWIAGDAGGVFEAAERDMMRRVLRLGERRVGELVTHRSQVVGLDLEDPPEVNREKIAASGHSRFPVYEGNLDRVVGMVSVKTLWARGDGGPLDLRQAMTERSSCPRASPRSKRSSASAPPAASPAPPRSWRRTTAGCAPPRPRPAPSATGWTSS